jgi:hypothetical protein
MHNSSLLALLCTPFVSGSLIYARPNIYRWPSCRQPARLVRLDGADAADEVALCALEPSASA